MSRENPTWGAPRISVGLTGRLEDRLDQVERAERRVGLVSGDLVALVS